MVDRLQLGPPAEVRLETYMAIQPDYGLRLLRDGYDPGVELHFYNIPIDGFDVLAEGR